MRKLISAIKDGVFEEWMGIIAVILIIIPVIVNIVTRSLFKVYFIPLEAIALFAYVWIGYGFFGYLYKVDEHLDVRFVTNLFPPLGQKVLDLLRDIFCIALSGYMTYWGFKLCVGNLHRMVVGTHLSLSIGYASILFGFFDGVVRGVFVMARHIMDWPKKEVKEVSNNG